MASSANPKKVWFIKVVFDSGRQRVKFLPNQTLTIKGLKGEVEEPCNEEWSVEIEKSIRENVPLNTIFATTEVLKKATSYKATDVFLVETLKGAITPSSVEHANPNIKAMYQSYCIGLRNKMNGVTSEKEARPTYLSKMKADEKFNPPSKEKDSFFVPEDKWYHLLRNVRTGINTLISGPAGTGKTEISKRIAELLGRNFYVFDMGAMQDPIASLMGVHRLKDGKSVFEYAEFTKAIKDPKAFILLDEINRAPIMSNNILFPCLDFRKALNIYVAGCEDERKIEVAEGVVFVATANLGGEYVGTSSLDRALLDRFQLVELEYMDPKDEADILVSKFSIDDGAANIITSIASTIRQQYAVDKLSNFVSTRHTQQVAELVKDGFGLVESLQSVFLPLFEGSVTEENSEKYIIMNILLNK